MSTFEGYINEFGTQIIVDKFKASYLEASDYGSVPESVPSSVSAALFLSHCHLDHMYGLDSRNVNFNIIYVSEMSKRILLNFPDPVDRRDASTFLAADQNKPRHQTTQLGYEGRYKHLEPYLRTLEMGVPTKVEGVQDDIYVTALNANHCPGSCMFLFDSAHRRVLYTGDFRLEASALEVVVMETPALVDVDKRIDCMYIDTSHCSSGRPTWYIPHRTAVVRHVLDLVAQVPASDGVFIKCKQMVGFERLFKAMAERFQTKVHVNECWLRIFAGDPALAHVFTNDPSKARIHAHHDILDGQKPDYYNSHGLPLPCCKQFLNTPRRHLFLSINGCRYPGTRMWDPDIQKLDYRPPIDVQRPCGKGWHLVPYQQHSSVSEIEAFIRRVNPRVLYPCVVDPDAKITIHDVWGSLRRIRKTAEEDYFRYVAANFNHQKAVVHRPIGSRMDCGSDPSPHTNRTIPHTYEHSSNAGGLQKSSDSSESASMPSSANGSKYTAGFVSRRKAAIGKRLLRTTSCGGAVQRGRQLRSTTGHNNRVALTSCASDYSATLFVRSKSGSGDKDAKISNSVLNVNDSQSRTQTVECGTSGVNESATLEGVYYAMDTTEVRGATVCIDLT